MTGTLPIHTEVANALILLTKITKAIPKGILKKTKAGRQLVATAWGEFSVYMTIARRKPYEDCQSVT